MEQLKARERRARLQMSSLFVLVRAGDFVEFYQKLLYHCDGRQTENGMSQSRMVY